MRTPTCADCAYCIDGMIPAGYRLDLGPVYERCPYCIALGIIPPCHQCDDLASFPANYSCPHCMEEALAARGLLAVICPGCLGVTYVTSRDDGDESQ